jgi:hypothetical protein
MRQELVRLSALLALLFVTACATVIPSQPPPFNPCSAQSPMRPSESATDIRDPQMTYATGTISVSACVVSDRQDVVAQGGLYVSARFGVIGTDGSLRTMLGQSHNWDQATYGSFPQSPHWRIPVGVSGSLAATEFGHIIAPLVAQVTTETCTTGSDPGSCQGKQHVATTTFLTPARCEPTGTCTAPHRFSPDACLAPLPNRRPDIALRDVQAPTGLVYGKLVAHFGGCLASDRFVALGDTSVDVLLFGAVVSSGGPVWQVNAGDIVENAGPLIRRALPGYRLPRSIALYDRDSATFAFTAGQDAFLDHALARLDVHPCQPEHDGSCSPLPESVLYDVVAIEPQPKP